jgi:hypothetical protein
VHMSDLANVVKREPSGHRRLPQSSVEEHRVNVEMPSEDANANQHYVSRPARAPNRTAKPLGSATPGVNMNAPRGKMFDASLFQKSRQ